MEDKAAVSLQLLCNTCVLSTEKESGVKALQAHESPSSPKLEEKWQVMSDFWSPSEPALCLPVRACRQPCCLLLRASEKPCSHGSRIRSHLWSVATKHAGKKEAKKKNKELDAQTNLPETGIEFLHIHYFCCALRMTETRSQRQNQDNLWALWEKRRFLVKWAGRIYSLVFVLLIHLKITILEQSQMNSVYHICDLALPVASLDGWFLKLGCVWLAAGLPMGEHCSWDIVDTHRDFRDPVTIESYDHQK